ncbi:MAG: hypothetical protein EBZ69_08390 [Alphaproteobacteria bacterium]|nr:hypothetical protein [Alphaproteobacteria bacterium]NDC56805.1 hypothetical protein [Alphaproteobacteria bacterium]
MIVRKVGPLIATLAQLAASAPVLAQNAHNPAPTPKPSAQDIYEIGRSCFNAMLDPHISAACDLFRPTAHFVVKRGPVSFPALLCVRYDVRVPIDIRSDDGASTVYPDNIVCNAYDRRYVGGFWEDGRLLTQSMRQWPSVLKNTPPNTVIDHHYVEVRSEQRATATLIKDATRCQESITEGPAPDGSSLWGDSLGTPDVECAGKVVIVRMYQRTIKDSGELKICVVYGRPPGFPHSDHAALCKSNHFRIGPTKPPVGELTWEAERAEWVRRMHSYMISQ